MSRTLSAAQVAFPLVLIFLSFRASAYATETPGDSVTGWLPDSVVMYAEMPSPTELVNLVLDHPLRERVEAMPVYQFAWQSDGFVKLRSGISLFEASMGKRWRRVLEELTVGGISVALDAQTEGVVVMIQARDREIIGQLRDSAFAALRGNKLAGSEGDPIRSGEYRGVTAYVLQDNIRAAALANVLIITNKADLGKAIIDRYLDGGPTSLSQKESFAEAYSKRPASAAAWGYVDVDMIRDSGEAEELYSGKTDNFFAELLFGGIMSNLQSTPYASAALFAHADRLKLELTTPHENDWVGENRAYYFGPAGDAQAPSLLKLDNQVFSLSTYRDMSQAWLRSDDLMTATANDQLAQADTQLTTFFSGRDFGEDILGSLEPGIQIVAVRQNFDNILPRPAIKLPAFALNFRMREPEETQPELRRVFQSFIGFLNVVGAMNGNPQFDQAMESTDDFQIVSASYVPDRDSRESTDAAISYNFSPTVAFAGSQLVISSTTGLAHELLKHSGARKSQSSNTAAELKAETLHRILEDNRGQLVAQNMLEKGHSQEEAEGEIGVLLSLLELFDGANAQLETTADQLALSIRLALAPIDQ